jgi:hypothetical protein
VRFQNSGGTLNRAAKTTLTRSFGAASPEAGEADNWWRGTRHPNSALDKVPHFKSSPFGRGEERCAELCKGFSDKERLGSPGRAVLRGLRRMGFDQVGDPIAELAQPGDRIRRREM